MLRYLSETRGAHGVMITDTLYSYDKAPPDPETGSIYWGGYLNTICSGGASYL